MDWTSTHDNAGWTAKIELDKAFKIFGSHPPDELDKAFKIFGPHSPDEAGDGNGGANSPPDVSEVAKGELRTLFSKYNVRENPHALRYSCTSWFVVVAEWCIYVAMIWTLSVNWFWAKFYKHVEMDFVNRRMFGICACLSTCTWLAWIPLRCITVEMKKQWFGEYSVLPTVIAAMLVISFISYFVIAHIKVFKDVLKPLGILATSFVVAALGGAPALIIGAPLFRSRHDFFLLVLFIVFIVVVLMYFLEGEEQHSVST